ncbi:MAG: hypothetical protein EWV91_08455 [Microcystis aeruginosa Ma_QC_Ca_00000000_S207]|uniref:Uncharacterized protein n=1 Tax=Microcystis aeruginosa Ma_QC_Ca_00000000_S207 TaxID=2486251 RepID=A0A552FQA9_MICAE|nr:MAG: hypothetical protein EWV91_08455 [Microcystis aeruginosa Ma_QC_Ca_00000000_S207]
MASPHFTPNIQESRFFKTINVICSQQRYNKNSTFLDKNREEIVSIFPILPLTQISLNPGRTRLIPL